MKTFKTILTVTLFSAFLFASCEAEQDFYEDDVNVDNVDVNANDGNNLGDTAEPTEDDRNN